MLERLKKPLLHRRKSRAVTETLRERRKEIPFAL